MSKQEEVCSHCKKQFSLNEEVWAAWTNKEEVRIDEFAIYCKPCLIENVKCEPPNNGYRIR
jgi:hypothetical protein